MIRRILYLITGLLICLSANSCLDEIGFSRPEGELNEFVIQGRIVKSSPSIASVEITEVFDKSGFVNPRRVSVKSVTLINTEGQSAELDEVSSGIYEVEIPDNDPGFAVETGMGFKVEVLTITGDTYESEFETINPVPDLKDLEARLIQKDIYDSEADRISSKPFIRYTVDVDLDANPDGNKPFLKWDIIETYALTDSPPGREPKVCYITGNANITNVTLIDANETSETALVDYELYDAPVTYVFAEGYYATVIQESLNAQSFAYWDQLRQVVDRSGSIFEAPAGKVITNIISSEENERGAIGYFYATQQDTVRMFISPEDAGNPNTFCPPPMAAPGFGCTLGNCCDCLRFGNSTTEKPEFWIR